MKKIIVIHFPCQPHFFSYGGFDIQMDRVIELTNNSKVISKKVDLWSKSEQFDIAHFWGVSESHKRNVMFCKNNGIKTVVSGLFSQKSYKLKCKQKIFNFLNKISFNKSVLYDFDIITVINKQQAQVVNEFFGIKTSKIKIVPTILDDYLYNVDKINSKNNKKFVLCVGTICSRKNQIKLAEACIKLDYECIFVGRFETSEISYIKKFNKLIDNHKNIITHYDNLSIEELCNLYQTCQSVACISHSETEPASILEGMYFEKPIIASDLLFARIDKFKNLIYCNQNNNNSIINALKISFDSNKDIKYPNFNRNENYSNNVTSLYSDIYTKLVNNN
jgi:glycosyltransferase involved in cell wall biosynthesis